MAYTAPEEYSGYRKALFRMQSAPLCIRFDKLRTHVSTSRDIILQIPPSSTYAVINFLFKAVAQTPFSLDA